MEKEDKILDNLKYDNNLTYKQIFQLNNEGKLYSLYQVFKIEEKDCFCITNIDSDKFDFFFNVPITIHYKLQNKDREEILINNIYSTEQIEKQNTVLAFNNPYVIYDNNKIDYKTAKFQIFEYIRDNILEVCNEMSNYNEFIFNHTILNKENFKKSELSEYFNDYFVYNSKTDTEFFQYDKTSNRNEFYKKYLIGFLLSKELSFFKFCGPSSTGKSTTLLKLSRDNIGIVYLNLKRIHKLEKKHDYIKYYNLIIYEFGRLSLSDEEKKNLKKCLKKI